jgi:hypothetical protein
VNAVDYITKVDLEKSINQIPLVENHKEYLRMSINLSPNGFWDKYLANDAEFWMGPFMEQKGEKEVESGDWTEPATDEEKKYDTIPGKNSDLTVKLKRRLFAKF